MKLLHKQKGFTLIELAFVLVVVALILGGVFVGGSAVLENARTATLLGQIKDLATAAREFKARYGYFPGDLPDAGTLITGATCSGAGDGIVNTTTESRCALEHLVKAGMLSKMELSGSSYRIPHTFGGGEVSLWFTPFNENAVRVTNLPCKIALQIDAKLDNASSTPLASGFVIAVNSLGATLDTCVVGGSVDPVGYLLVRY